MGAACSMGVLLQIDLMRSVLVEMEVLKQDCIEKFHVTPFAAFNAPDVQEKRAVLHAQQDAEVPRIKGNFIGVTRGYIYGLGLVKLVAYIGVLYGLYRVYIGDIFELYTDIGKCNGNYSNGLYRM